MNKTDKIMNAAEKRAIMSMLEKNNMTIDDSRAKDFFSNQYLFFCYPFSEDGLLSPEETFNSYAVSFNDETVITIEKFWEIIEISRKKARYNRQILEEELTRQLYLLRARSVKGFGNILEKLLDLLYNQRTANLMFRRIGYVSDDTLEYFVLWLISKGKEVYENAIKSPESILSVKDYDESIGFEKLLYIPQDIYNYKIGLQSH